MKHLRLLVLTMGVLWAGAVFAADAPAPAAYVTEINAKGGTVAVLRAGEAQWRAPQPLLPLRAGDRIRVEGSAKVVVLYHVGGAVSITSANSPFTVAATGGTAGSSRQAKVVAEGITEYFVGRQDGPQMRRAATRGATAEMVYPLHTRVFPGPVVFEWEGPEHVTYTLKVIGPEGVIWEEKGLRRGRWRYPEAAPRLLAGTKYSWELEGGGGSLRSSFEIVNDAEARRVRGLLDDLQKQTGAGVPPTTAIVMRAALLGSQGLFAEARRELEAAAASAPEEPTLHLMLGRVYEDIGLTTRAAQAFERAHALSPRPQ